MVVYCMADGIPAYLVKNDHTGKKKVLHQARLLLWLADYGEPVRCDLIHISDGPSGSAPDQCPPRGSAMATQCQVAVCSMAWT